MSMQKELTLGYPDPYITPDQFPFVPNIFRHSRSIPLMGWDGVDALVVWGGEDISSSYYGQKPHRTNQNKYGVPTARDTRESDAIDEAVKRGIPIIGVCRGAQFLCAKAGGSLVQHVGGHGGSHPIICKNGFDGQLLEMTTSSAHHQMMMPYNLPEEDYDLIAWSSTKRGANYFGEEDEIPEMKDAKEPEIIWFRKLRGLAIQGHPEWMDSTCNFNKYVTHLIREFVIVGETV